MDDVSSETCFVFIKQNIKKINFKSIMRSSKQSILKI